MIICRECKHPITDDKYLFIEGLGVYFCSKKCAESYSKIEKEKEDKNRLFGFICNLFHISDLYPQMWAEIKRFKEKQNLTYSQMASIAHYVFEVKREQPWGTTIYQIGLPENIEGTKQYWKDINNKKILAEKLDKPAATKKIIVPNYTQKKKTGITYNPEDV